MSKVVGHGGYWIIASTLGNRTPHIQHNAEYECETGSEIHETRSAGCKGWVEGLPVAKRVESLTMRVAEDDASYPQALGVVEGAELSVWLKRGALDQLDLVNNTMVKTVRVINDQKKARWVEITCKYGQYYRQVLSPFAPEPGPSDAELGS